MIPKARYCGFYGYKCLGQFGFFLKKKGTYFDIFWINI